MATNCFTSLPDIVILNVLAYLDLEALVNTSKTCRRLRCLCADRLAVRCVDEALLTGNERDDSRLLSLEMRIISPTF